LSIFLAFLSFSISNLWFYPFIFIWHGSRYLVIFSFSNSLSGWTFRQLKISSLPIVELINCVPCSSLCVIPRPLSVLYRSFSKILNPLCLSLWRKHYTWLRLMGRVDHIVVLFSSNINMNAMLAFSSSLHWLFFFKKRERKKKWVNDFTFNFWISKLLRQ